ncbi:hypothetical protein ACU4GD_10385 [Cupriavidus basilensis]
MTSHDATKGGGPEKTEQRMVGAFSGVQLNALADVVSLGCARVLRFHHRPRGHPAAGAHQPGQRRG